MPAGKDEELRADAEAIEGNFREHDSVSTGDVPVVEVGVAREDLNERAMAVAEGSDGWRAAVSEEGVVEEAEGVEGDVGLRD